MPNKYGSVAVRKRCFNVFDFLYITVVVSSRFIPADFLIFSLTFIVKAHWTTFCVNDRIHAPQEIPKRELFVVRVPCFLLRLSVDDYSCKV